MRSGLALLIGIGCVSGLLNAGCIRGTRVHGKAGHEHYLAATPQIEFRDTPSGSVRWIGAADDVRVGRLGAWFEYGCGYRVWRPLPASKEHAVVFRWPGHEPVPKMTDVMLDEAWPMPINVEDIQRHLADVILALEANLDHAQPPGAVRLIQAELLAWRDVEVYLVIPMAPAGSRPDHSYVPGVYRLCRRKNSKARYDPPTSSCGSTCTASATLLPTSS